MLSKELESALNEHLRAELYASHLYLAMAAYCESVPLPGAARWMQIQSLEERDHAMRFFRYIADRDGRITVGSLDEPLADFGSPRAVFEAALEHERAVSERINDLYRLGGEAGDYATQAFLQWFVNEQVEEESTLSGLVDALRMLGDDTPGLLALDRELGSRSEVDR
jgi:ferritin